MSNYLFVFIFKLTSKQSGLSCMFNSCWCSSLSFRRFLIFSNPTPLVWSFCLSASFLVFLVWKYRISCSRCSRISMNASAFSLKSQCLKQFSWLITTVAVLNIYRPGGRSHSTIRPWIVHWLKHAGVPVQGKWIARKPARKPRIRIPQSWDVTAVQSFSDSCDNGTDYHLLTVPN